MIRNPYICSLSQSAIIMLLTLLISACDKETPTPSVAGQSAPKAENINVASASKTLFEYGSATLTEALESAVLLDKQIREFLANPSQESLKKAQGRWREALFDYRKFMACAQISVTDADTFAKINRLDYQITSFPIQPGFLDKFGPHKYSGLVNDIGMEMSEENLQQQHGLTDLSEAVLGFYSIEFMLFDRETARDASDFLRIETLDKALAELGFEKLSEIPNNRRRRLLELQAEVLVKNIQALRNLWNSNEGETAAWDALADREKIALAQQSMHDVLTTVLLEISELNQVSENSEVYESKISPTLKTASFAEHQAFIGNAVNGFQALAYFYEEDKKKAILEHLTALEAILQKSTIDQGNDAKDHWRKVFSLVKQASDVSLASTVPED